MYSLIQLRRLVPLVLVCLALLPLIYAQDSPRANSQRARAHVASRERPVAPAPRPHSQRTDDNPLAPLVPRAPLVPSVSPPPDGEYGGSTAEGHQALQHLTSGGFLTAIGWESLASNTTGSFSTGVGAGTLAINNGNENTATGAGALLLNTSAVNNTANGALALLFNEMATDNTAVGNRALENNDSSVTGVAAFNDAVGSHALFNNVNGFSNNALGESALFFNVNGSGNTAVGDLALENNDTGGPTPTLGNSNTAVGAEALAGNTDGDSNNAVGFEALTANTIGVQNNAMGFLALGSNTTGASNVAVGDSALSGNSAGSFNTVVGWEAGLTVEGDDNIYIGATSAAGVTSETGHIRIGDPTFVTDCNIAGISGATTAAGVPVLVDGTGKLGTLPSSKRFKTDIKPMDKASEVLFALNPVTFRYKKQIEAKCIPQFGLVAEEVEKVNPDLVVRDRDNKVQAVRYEAVNAMLLNEFIKEHHTVQDLKATAEKQQDTIALQEGQIKALTASLREQATQIQKVSAQLETIRPAPQVVENR